MVGVEVDGGVGVYLGEAGGTGGENRGAGGHGFQAGEAEAFVERGGNEGERVTVKFSEVGVGNEAEEVDRVLKTLCFNEVL